MVLLWCMAKHIQLWLGVRTLVSNLSVPNELLGYLRATYAWVPGVCDWTGNSVADASCNLIHLRLGLISDDLVPTNTANIASAQRLGELKGVGS